MPTYDYECPACGHACEVIHPISECDKKHPCPACQVGMQRVISGSVAVKPPVDTGWEYENGGRGRECTQFVDNRYKPGDKRATRYFRSQNEMVEAAKRAGYTVERQR